MIDSTFGKIGCVILAGGFGTRIRHLHPTVPKPMIEVEGRPFLEWLIHFLAVQEIRDFSISLGYRGDVIESYLRKSPHDDLVIHTVREEVPLGTAGGFLFASQKLADCDTFLVVNGDSLLLVDIKASLQSLQGVEAEAVIWGRTLADCSRYGSLSCDEQGRLKAFKEKQPGAGLVNSGIYLLPRKLLDYFSLKRPLSFETEVFPDLLSQNKMISVVSTVCPFIDIGVPEALTLASSFIRDNKSTFFEGRIL